MRHKILSSCLLPLLLVSSCGQTTTKVDMSKYISDDNYRNYYHIFVGSFADSNGDKIGDINGITQKLDYLRKKDDPHGTGSLGIDGIFLSPIHESPTYHKYDIVDYKSIDSSFGTIEDFENLVKGAHDRGIKIILDLVINHVSSDHEWLKSAIKTLETSSLCVNTKEDGTPSQECISANPYVDYFHFTKANAYIDDNVGLQSKGMKMGSGNSTYSGYKYAGFANGMADLNLENEHVKAYLTEMINFWLDKGVDGFRLDAVTSYFKDNVVKNYATINWVNSVIKNKLPSAYVVGEGPWGGGGLSDYIKNTAIDSYFDFDTSIKNTVGSAIPYWIYGTTLEDRADKMANMLSYRSSFTKGLNNDGIEATFLANHDIGRAVGLFVQSGKARLDALKLYYGIMNLISGNFFMYYGEEIGTRGINNRDENKRGPFNWGIDSNYVTKALYPNELPEQVLPSLEEQIKDSNSLWTYIHNLLIIKDTNPQIMRGTTTINKVYNNVIELEKSYKDDKITIFINLNETEAKVENLNNFVLSAELETKDKKCTLKSNTLTLPEYGIAILRNGGI